MQCRLALQEWHAGITGKQAMQADTAGIPGMNYIMAGRHWTQLSHSGVAGMAGIEDRHCR
jgi:uncharacterized UPF0160 family protein